MLRGLQPCERLPAAGFVCFDCGAHTDAEQIPTRDWFHYHLTELGRQAVMRGALRRIDNGAPTAGMVGQGVLRDFLGTFEGLRRRTGRVYSVLDIAYRPVGGPEEPRTRQDHQAGELIPQLIHEKLRAGDVSAETDSGLVVLLPETTQKDAIALSRAINAHLTASLEFQPRLRMSLVSYTRARALLGDGEHAT